MELREPPSRARRRLRAMSWVGLCVVGVIQLVRGFGRDGDRVVGVFGCLQVLAGVGLLVTIASEERLRRRNAASSRSHILDE